MIRVMEPLHISEGDLAKDVRSILRRVETGAEVIVERDAHPVAVIRPAEPMRRKISECIALLPADSTATIDPDFAKDVEAAIAAHRESLVSTGGWCGTRWRARRRRIGSSRNEQVRSWIR